jgi:DNA helicase-2/ATP-dependent DNA helicase PcrA
VTVDPEALLDRLDPEQRAVATALLGPVCVVAGAGTGKTRAITHRIAYGVRTGTYSPSAVLAVTFTARAAGELRERLRGLGAPGVQARTFHAAALRQLAYFLPRVAHRQLPRLIEHKAPVVAQAAAACGMEVDRAAVRDMAAEIEWAKVNRWTAQDYQREALKAGRGTPAGHDPAAVARMITVYESILKETGAMDFEDVLLGAAGLMMEYPQVADEVRNQYRHIVVDEYQDVSPIQQHLLDLWLGPRQELCVVGDPNQTIYSFTGASARFLTDFPERHPGAVVIRLVRDYRSTPQVVWLANSLLRRARHPHRGVPAAVGQGVELVAQRPSGPAVAYRSFADDGAEAAGIAAAVRRLVSDGVSPHEVAVLFRTNSQSEPFEHALAQVGVPYQVRGAQRFFSRREVKQAVALLRSEARAPSQAPTLTRVRDALGGAGWTAEPPVQRGQRREQWESLDALVRLCYQMHDAGATTMDAIVALVLDRQAHDHAPPGAGVTLASLHSAKGLEWDAVFMAGLSDGLMPISLASGPEQVAEERRLLYVGVTRARERLMLSYALARHEGGAASRQPSRFMVGLWPDEAQGAAKAESLGWVSGGQVGRGPGTGERGLRSAVLRRVDGELDPVEAEVHERLIAWRSASANAASAPAFTILPDVTLRAIACAHPTSIRELAAVRGIGPVKIARYGESLLEVLRTPHARRA